MKNRRSHTHVGKLNRRMERARSRRTDNQQSKPSPVKIYSGDALPPNLIETLRNQETALPRKTFLQNRIECLRQAFIYSRAGSRALKAMRKEMMACKAELSALEER
jgi:hypothetical protein